MNTSSFSASKMGNTLRARNETPPLEAKVMEEEEFTCEICLENSTTKFNYKSCRYHHPFCAECIFKYIEQKLDHNISKIRCPSPDCHSQFDPLSCRPVLPNHLFQKWCDVLSLFAVRELESCYCPRPDCSALVVNECGGTVLKAVCPQCKNHFCFKCKQPWHAGYGCHEIVETRDGNDIEFGELVERKKWKRCPGCGYCVGRAGGCCQVRCRCGTEFCYKCGAEDIICMCSHGYVAMGFFMDYFK